MASAGLIIEPHTLNFENLYNFLRCSNDVNDFLISLLVSDFPSVPSISEAVLGYCKRGILSTLQCNAPDQNIPTVWSSEDRYSFSKAQ